MQTGVDNDLRAPTKRQPRKSRKEIEAPAAARKKRTAEEEIAIIGYPKVRARKAQCDRSNTIRHKGRRSQRGEAGTSPGWNGQPSSTDDPVRRAGNSPCKDADNRPCHVCTESHAEETHALIGTFLMAFSMEHEIA